MNPTALSQLKTLFPSDRLATDSQTLEHYGRDWTKHIAIQPGAVVFPSQTPELVELVKWARREKVGLVPSGGRTGLSGGACASKGEVVVSFEKMARIFDFNAIDRTVRCEAGVITETLQKYVWNQGYFFPVDFAARGSSHIGGNIATNAGGVKVIRYGSMRDWVAGLQVVTGQGEVLELNKGLVKNATGFDLRHLFIGSEGSLGFVTEAIVKFTRQYQSLTVLVVGVPDLDSVMKVFRAFRDRVSLTAFEYFSELALKHVIASSHLQRPFTTPTPHYLLVEVEAQEADRGQEQILSIFEKCVEEGWVVDGAISQSETQSREFWRLREDISEATSAFSPYKNDVSVTISRVPDFLRRIEDILTKNYPDFEVVWFGHIGDGNMHINILKPPSWSAADFLKKCEGVSESVFVEIEKLGGSVSAEHGVGLVKKPFLNHTRSSTEIQLMKGIKRVFDPDNIMNPSKIFD